MANENSTERVSWAYYTRFNKVRLFFLSLTKKVHADFQHCISDLEKEQDQTFGSKVKNVKTNLQVSTD